MLAREFSIRSDRFNQKFLYNANTKKYYAVNSRTEVILRIVQMGIFNSAAISYLVSYFLKLGWLFGIGMAALIYLGFLLVFYHLYLPKLKEIRRVQEKKSVRVISGKQFPYIIFAFVVIATGLGICLLTNQVEAGPMTYIVYGAITVCAVNVAYHLKKYLVS